MSEGHDTEAGARTESGELNCRTQVNIKGGIPVKLKEGLKKYCSRLRKHTLHKIKRK